MDFDKATLEFICDWLSEKTDEFILRRYRCTNHAQYDEVKMTDGAVQGFVVEVREHLQEQIDAITSLDAQSEIQSRDLPPPITAPKPPRFITQTQQIKPANPAPKKKARPNEAFGSSRAKDLVLAYMEKEKLNQSQMAAAAGLSAPTVGTILGGGRVSEKTISKLSDLIPELGVSK